MNRQKSPEVKESSRSNEPPNCTKSAEAEKAIMADNDLNKLLQLAHHCSNQMSQSDDETKGSNGTTVNGEDAVLAASSLHLPLIEGRSFLDNEQDTKLSSQTNGQVAKADDNANRPNSTEEALLSLKHQKVDGYREIYDQAYRNEQQKRPSRRTMSKSLNRPNKPNNSQAKKKSKQKQSPSQSQSDLFAAALLRGVTMRPSGKWVSFHFRRNPFNLFVCISLNANISPNVSTSQQAQLYYAGKSRYIGVFDTREKAAKAYEIAREKLKNASSSNEGSQSQEATENAVAAARKAAFEGVNRG